MKRRREPNKQESTYTSVLLISTSNGGLPKYVAGPTSSSRDTFTEAIRDILTLGYFQYTPGIYGQVMAVEIRKDGEMEECDL